MPDRKADDEVAIVGAGARRFMPLDRKGSPRPNPEKLGAFTVKANQTLRLLPIRRRIEA
jgi:hypothetical protein